MHKLANYYGYVISKSFDLGMKRAKYYLIIMFLGVSSIAYSQQEPQFSQNMFNHMTINPGYAGMKQLFCAKLFYRTQWVGFKGHPETMLINVDGPFKEIHGGAGLNFMKDQIGNYNITIVRLNYSYHYALSNGGKLGFGVRMGILNMATSANWIEPEPGEIDEVIPYLGEKSTSLNVGAGITYMQPDMHLGLSISQINQPKQAFTDAAEGRLKRHIYITGGYDFPISKSIKFKPQLFTKTDFTTAQIDLNLIAEAEIGGKFFWGGLSLRPGDAIVPMVGFELKSNTKYALNFGYAYDITTSMLSGYNNGTHELFLGYCIKLDKPYIPTIYRNTLKL